MSIYEQVGGEEFFTDLVDNFYQGVSADPILRPMYPEGDLSEAKEKLRLFLIQYWGVPETYSAKRGHPRLRMRHAPFQIDEAAKAAWLKHMQSALNFAVSKHDSSDEIHGAIGDYFQMASYAMVNSPNQ